MAVCKPLEGHDHNQGHNFQRRTFDSYITQKYSRLEASHTSNGQEAINMWRVFAEEDHVIKR